MFLTQPEADALRLNRLGHDIDQTIRQGQLVNFAAGGARKGCHRLFGIVLLAVETPVDGSLNPAAQRGERSRDQQGGSTTTMDEFSVPTIVLKICWSKTTLPKKTTANKMVKVE